MGGWASQMSCCYVTFIKKPLSCVFIQRVDYQCHKCGDTKRIPVQYRSRKARIQHVDTNYQQTGSSVTPVVGAIANGTVLCSKATTLTRLHKI